ncbi:hypothetical protein CB1_000390006 [Camelus ferus]|nr:hypothetical protein CB1_000390006 [Camelus ferus]
MHGMTSPHFALGPSPVRATQLVPSTPRCLALLVITRRDLPSFAGELFLHLDFPSAHDLARDSSLYCSLDSFIPGGPDSPSTNCVQSKLVKYFSRQLSCKKKVALQERNAELDGFPQLRHWFRIVDVRKEVLEEITPGQLSLEDLLEMTDEQVCETVEKYGANREECARLNASLSCLRNVHMSVPGSLTLPCLSKTVKQEQASGNPQGQDAAAAPAEAAQQNCRGICKEGI